MGSKLHDDPKLPYANMRVRVHGSVLIAQPYYSKYCSGHCLMVDLLRGAQEQQLIFTCHCTQHRGLYEHTGQLEAAISYRSPVFSSLRIHHWPLEAATPRPCPYSILRVSYLCIGVPKNPPLLATALMWLSSTSCTSFGAGVVHLGTVAGICSSIGVAYRNNQGCR